MGAADRYPNAKGATFRDDLAQRVHDGTKTETRRIVTPQPPVGALWFYNADTGALSVNDGEPILPPWRVGDLLYVRETHYRFGHWEPVEGATTPGGKQKWRFVAQPSAALFEPPATGYRLSPLKNGDNGYDWYKRLARFMPKACARTVVEVVSVHPEHLHCIGRSEAIAEGCPFPEPDGRAANTCPRRWFAALWDEIHGPGAWEADPVVWVYRFRRIEP